MTNCGIIGYGKMGRIREKALRESGQANIVSIYDPAPASPFFFPGVRRAGSPDEIIADKQIEAVFICTPNDLNQLLTIQALRAGKHVFCEKPPAFTAAGVEEIREAEVQSGCKLMYGLNHRHHASIKAMKQIVEQGTMGRILWMRGRYGKEVDASFFQSWRAYRKSAGGGIMLDQGIHMLDLMLYFGGGFDEVQAMVSNLYWRDCDIEDNAFVNLRSSATGICASLHSSMTQWGYLFSFEIYLEHGALMLDGLKTASGAYGDEILTIRRKRALKRNSCSGADSGQTSGGRVKTVEDERLAYPVDASFLAEVQHFVACILNGEPVRCGSSEDALHVMRIVDRIYDVR